MSRQQHLRFSLRFQSILLTVYGLTNITKSNNDKLNCFTIKINLDFLIGKNEIVSIGIIMHIGQVGSFWYQFLKMEIVLFKGITCKIATFDVLNFLMKFL